MSKQRKTQARKTASGGIKGSLEEQVVNLQLKVDALHNALVSMLGEDAEGNYRPEFIKELLESLKEKPEFTYTDSDTFLEQVNDA